MKRKRLYYIKSAAPLSHTTNNQQTNRLTCYNTHYGDQAVDRADA